MLWLDVPSCSLIRQPSNPTLHMLECCYVKRLSVLLSTPFIIVAHNRLPHITLRLREQGLLALSPQRHEQHNDDWGGVEGINRERKLSTLKPFKVMGVLYG